MMMYATQENILTREKMTVFSAQQIAKNVSVTLDVNSAQTASISLMENVSKHLV